MTSSVGYSLARHAHNRLRPTRGERIVVQPGFRRARRRRSISALAARRRADQGLVAPLHLLSIRRGRLYQRASTSRAPTIRTPVRLTDRFFLGSPQIRGFDIRGVGPRIRHALCSTRRRGADRQWRPPDHRKRIHRRFDRRPRLLSRPRRARNSARRQRPRARHQAVHLRRRSAAPVGVRRPRRCSTFRRAIRACSRRCSTSTARSSAPTMPRRRRSRRSRGRLPDSTSLYHRRRLAFREVYLGDSPSPRLRSASASTGTRPSVRSGSISPTPCFTSAATTPNSSLST